MKLTEFLIADLKSENYKYWKKQFLVVYVCFWIAFLSTMFLLFLLIDISKFTYGTHSMSESSFNFSDEITFDKNFTFREKEIVRNIIYDIKPIYRQFFTNVLFVKNRTSIDEYCDGCYGINLVNNNPKKPNIVILYRDDERSVRRTIAHELLHNVIYRSEKYHPIVYDLAEKGVVYR